MTIDTVRLGGASLSVSRLTTSNPRNTILPNRTEAIGNIYCPAFCRKPSFVCMPLLRSISKIAANAGQISDRTLQERMFFGRKLCLSERIATQSSAASPALRTDRPLLNRVAFLFIFPSPQHCNGLLGSRRCQRLLFAVIYLRSVRSGASLSPFRVDLYSLIHRDALSQSRVIWLRVRVAFVSLSKRCALKSLDDSVNYSAFFIRQYRERWRKKYPKITDKNAFEV